jgi:hypothetical protein
MAMFSKDLGIDLGTNNTQAAEGNQLILDEQPLQQSSLLSKKWYPGKRSSRYARASTGYH